MADNISITAGTGTNVATDQLGTGEHVQFMKIMDGTLDSTNKLIVDSTGSAKVSTGVVSITNPTALSDGASSKVLTDKIGRQIVVTGHARALVGTQSTTITTNSSTTVVTAGGASVFTDITSLIVTNSSTTPTTVTLSDGTKSYPFMVLGGGGFVAPFNPPLPATTVNTAWTLTCSDSATSIFCNIVYVKNI